MKEPQAINYYVFIGFLLLSFYGLIFTMQNNQMEWWIYVVYFIAQQFHYLRQKFAITKLKLKKIPNDDRLVEVLFFCVAIATFVYSFSGSGQEFFGHQLKLGIIYGVNLYSLWAFLSMCVFIVYKFRPIYCFSFFIHTLIYGMTFSFVDNFALSWVMLNVYHNVEYLQFCAPSNKHSHAAFWGVLLICTAIVYSMLKIPMIADYSLALVLSLSFTHYVIDGVIWKKSYRHYSNNFMKKLSQ